MLSRPGLVPRLAIAMTLIALSTVAAVPVWCATASTPACATSARSVSTTPPTAMPTSRRRCRAGGGSPPPWRGDCAGWAGCSATRRPARPAATVGPARPLPAPAEDSHVTVTPTSAPIRVDGRTIGSVRLTWVPGGVLDAEAGALHEQLDEVQTLSVAVVTALALLVAALVATTLARPIKRLTDATERMARGDLGARAPVGGGTEIEGLGRAFNRLAETLSREDDLRRAAAADIAHELRTPVAGLVARIEAAQDGVLDQHHQP